MIIKRKDDPLAFTELCKDAREIVLSLKEADPEERAERLKRHLKECPVCQKVLSTYFSAVLAEGDDPRPVREETPPPVLASTGEGEKIPDQAITVLLSADRAVRVISATGEIKNPIREEDPEAEASVIIGNGDEKKGKKLPIAVEIRIFQTASCDGAGVSIRMRRLRGGEDSSAVIKHVLANGRDGERIGEARRLGDSAVAFPPLPPGRYRLLILGKNAMIVELAAGLEG